MHTARMSPITTMARWLTSVRAGAIPEPVRRVARRAFIDTVGVAVAGSGSRVARGARGVALVCGGAGAGVATVLAPRHLRAPVRSHAASAAFANGVAAHALDFDDNGYAGFVHGSAVIVPAALALAEDRDRDGAALIDAYVVGIECEFALATALGQAPYERGWWTTGLYGGVGACAAACRALRLDAATTEAALGLAVVGAGGAKAGFGTDAKPVMVGRAAQAGIVHALLARAGCRGPVNAVEAPHGLADLVSEGRCDIDAFAALGRDWRLLSPGLDVKRMPLCLASHAAVAALRDVLAGRPAGAAILRIVCDVPPIVVKNLAYARPATWRQAQFSMPFAMAATVVAGDVTLALLDDAVVARPEIVAMMRRVDMVSSARWEDPDLRRRAPEGAWVRVEFDTGAAVERFCAMPPGAAAHPLADAQLDDKFTACVAPVWGARGAGRLLERLHELDRQASTRALFTALAGTSGGAVRRRGAPRPPPAA